MKIELAKSYLNKAIKYYSFEDIENLCDVIISDCRDKMVNNLRLRQSINQIDRNNKKTA